MIFKAKNGAEIIEKLKCIIICRPIIGIRNGMKNTAVYMELPLLKMTFHSLTKKDSTRTRLENSDYIQS